LHDHPFRVVLLIYATAIDGYVEDQSKGESPLGGRGLSNRYGGCIDVTT